MSAPKETNPGVAAENRTSERQESKPGVEGLSRRAFLGVGSASLASAALASMAVNAQERIDIEKGEHDHSVSNPGPENKPLFDEDPNSNFPPPTDSGNLDPVWYSFDLTHKRVQAGGWTNEVTQKVLPSSKDIAGVRMRLTAGSFRELHWHTSDEWAFMLYGNARVTVLNPDGTISWHSFRHGNATLLGEVGESVKTAQAILGHSDIETTLNTFARNYGLATACGRASREGFVPRCA